MKMENLGQKIKEKIKKGREHLQRGEYNQALENFKRAEQIINTLFPKGELKKREGEVRKELLASIFFDRAEVFRRLKKYEEAEEQLKKAIKFGKDNPRVVGESWFLWFCCSFESGRPIPKEVIRSTKNALWEWMTATKDPRELGRIFSFLGAVEEYAGKDGEIEKAICFYKAAAVIQEEIVKDERAFAYTSWELGRCYQESGQIQEAIKYLEKARQCFEKIGNSKKVEEIDLELKEINKGANI